MDRANGEQGLTSVGEQIVAVLAARGVDYFFGNAGTDFPPVIEAFARRAALGLPAPTPITVPHENTAMGMAHGYYLMAGRPQVVMVHTTVGTANALCGLLNASRQNVPILLFAGRTPITEYGHKGSRNRVIHWAQEAFDQAGMVREYVKWEYELRQANDVEAVLHRAIALATSEPFGPIYLTLPREVLAAPTQPEATISPTARLAATRPLGADPSAIAAAADIIAAAEYPVIVTSTVGRYPEAVAALTALVERFAIPVIVNWPRYVCLPSDHPMHLGYSPAPTLRAADAVVVLDCDVPWAIEAETPPSSAKIIHIGTDPLFQDYPMRSFASDVAITATPIRALHALHAALAERLAEGHPLVVRRRERVGEERRDHFRRRDAAFAAARTARPLSPVFVSRCIDEVRGSDSILINESPLQTEQLSLTQPREFFSAAAVGGLGWGLGAALGVKLAARDRLVIACVGDGAYMFGNPTSAHLVSRAHDLPFLTVIFNNRMWGAVSRATKFMYPDGYAAKSNLTPLTHLEPAPDYEKIVAASGGHGERVESPEQLKPALQRAIRAVREDKRQAVVNVLTEGI
ncbi:MAG: thiamine pyrophosphate-requiring protein [Alphaproteobacteria bacterium]|nr:thiamine pyrophosphate-requiring protein [Alphaproteobacteria bacterium]